MGCLALGSSAGSASSQEEEYPGVCFAGAVVEVYRQVENPRKSFGPEVPSSRSLTPSSAGLAAPVRQRRQANEDSPHGTCGFISHCSTVTYLYVHHQIYHPDKNSQAAGSPPQWEAICNIITDVLLKFRNPGPNAEDDGRAPDRARKASSSRKAP